jgi:hypothetical protein
VPDQTIEVRLKNPTMQPAGDVVELWESACHLLVHNAYGPLRPWLAPKLGLNLPKRRQQTLSAWRRSPKRAPSDWARLIRKLDPATTRPPPMALAPAISAVATALDMELRGTAASGCRRPIGSPRRLRESDQAAFATDNGWAGATAPSPKDRQRRADGRSKGIVDAAGRLLHTNWRVHSHGPLAKNLARRGARDLDHLADTVRDLRSTTSTRGDDLEDRRTAIWATTTHANRLSQFEPSLG